MRSVRMVGIEAWCSRPGCRYQHPLAHLHVSAFDAAAYARLSGRWLEDGVVKGLARWREGTRGGVKVRIQPDGSRQRYWPRGRRVPLPVALVCPSCGTVQAMGLT